MAGRGCGFQRTAVDWTWTSTHVTCWIEIPLQGTVEVRTLFTRLPSGHRAPQRAGAPPPADCAAGRHSGGTLRGRGSAPGLRHAGLQNDSAVACRLP